MLYKYIAVYKIRGISCEAESKNIVLFSDTHLKSNAILTSDIDSYCFDIDRSSALALMILKGIIGQSDTGTFEEKLSREIDDQRDKRNKRFGTGPFMVFQASGEVDEFDLRYQRDCAEFVVCLDGAPKESIRGQYVEEINGILASLCLAAESVCGIEKVGDVTVFFNDVSKPVYSFTLSGSADAYVSKKISLEVIDFVNKYSQTLSKDRQLISVTRLLAQSMDIENDRLRSFLSAWSALEIFINKTFNSYEDLFLKSLTGDLNPIIRNKYIERVRSVMQDKYRLQDKFVVIYSQLVPDSEENAEKDIDSFIQVKDIRDKLFHGDNVSEDQLPISDVQKLLRKLLYLHVMNES